MTLQLCLRFHSTSAVNCIGALLYLNRLSLLFSFSLSGFIFNSIPNAQMFLYPVVSKIGSNAQASDHLMHIERISNMWLQNRDDISYHRQHEIEDWYHEEEKSSESYTS